MLTIRDLTGQDLLSAPPEEIQRSVAAGTVSVPINCVVVETDTNLPYQAVSADVDWNDGSPPVHYPSDSAAAVQASPLTLSLRRNLGLGTYGIRVTATNNRAVPDQVSVTFFATVSPLRSTAGQPSFIFGPILPRDQGVPNRASWNLNVGTDMLVLESSVRMLLITVKGERLMLPDYGTNLRKIIFAPNLESVDALVSEEIIQALNLYEPRVALQSMQVDRNANARNVTVHASFLSKVAAQPFEINLQLA